MSSLEDFRKALRNVPDAGMREVLGAFGDGLHKLREKQKEMTAR